MHIYPAGVIGFLSWIGIMIYDPTIQTLISAPIVVPTVALALMLMPFWRQA